MIKIVLSFLSALCRFWKTAIVVLVPLIALPILFEGVENDSNQAYRCAYVMIIMSAYWVTEALPLAITAIIPVVLFPVLGLMTTDEVGKEYLKETNLMFMSGIMVAIAVEHCKLHTRIALKVLLAMGTGARWLMLGFMLTTAFFSMWISNTATTAMMVPIVTGVMNELDSSGIFNEELEEEEEGKDRQDWEEEEQGAVRQERKN